MRSGMGHIDEIYRHIVEDHCRNPRNHRLLDAPDAEARINNPFCGDDVLVQIKIDDGYLASVCAQGQGCAISQASASMMGEIVEGLEVSQSLERSEIVRRMLSVDQELSEEEADAIGDAVALRDVRRFPIRVKCALISWAALEDALREADQRGSADGAGKASE